MRFYGVREEDNFAQAVVEATDGEQFSIKLDMLDPSNNYEAILQLGGQRVRSYTAEPDTWPITFKHRRISKTEVQSLMFSKAVTTDDDKDSICDPAEIARLGEIAVTIKKVLSTLEGKTPCLESWHIGPQKAIYEKAKKVGAIQFRAGPTVNKPMIEYVTNNYDDEFDPVEFKIRCATRIGLQLLGHIPKDKESKSTKTAVKKRRSREEEEEEEEEEEAEEEEEEEDDKEKEKEEEEKEEKKSRPSKKSATEKKRCSKEEDERLAAREKRLVRELEEVRLAARTARLEREIEEVREARKRPRAESEESGPDPHDSSPPADGMSLNVKKERMKFDFSAGGTTAEPFDLTDLSD